MENIFTLTPVALAAIPVTVGLVQIIKVAGLPSKFAPIASIAIGVGAVALVATAWQAIVAQGVIVGLAASGLWSGGKALTTETVPEG